MRKLDKLQTVCIIGIIVVLVVGAWLLNGGIDRINERDNQRIQELVD